MDPLPLIDVGTAAAISSQEYCLEGISQTWWTCMTKAEWSGWMQAIFSVVAIVSAFLVAATAHWLQIQAERRKNLLLADTVALRLNMRINAHLNSRAKIVTAIDILFTPLDPDQFGLKFIVERLQSAANLCSDQDVAALIPAGKSISHALVQAMTTLEWNASSLSLWIGIEQLEKDRDVVITAAKAGVDGAYETLAFVSRELGIYLQKRRFKNIPSYQLR